MKKDILLSYPYFLVRSLSLQRDIYGTTYEFRAKLKVCEEHYKPYIKKIEKCKKAARFGNLGN